MEFYYLCDIIISTKGKNMYYINDKEYKCTVAVTLDIFNDRWKLAIIWHLLDGEKRFKDLHEIISEITQKKKILFIEKFMQKFHQK